MQKRDLRISALVAAGIGVFLSGNARAGGPEFHIIQVPVGGAINAMDYFALKGAPVPAGWTVITLFGLSANGTVMAGQPTHR